MTPDPMRFSLEDIRRFAAWSGDRNPLHVDPDLARRTWFGQPIAHGMLSVLGALARAHHGSPDAALGLDVEFTGAVRPDVAHEIDVSAEDDGMRIVVRSGDTQVLSIRLERGASAADDRVDVAAVAAHATVLRTTPAVRDDADLEAKLELSGIYATADVPTDYIGRGALRPLQARVLALCSYLVGMELPGLKSLFTRVSLQLAPSAPGTDTLVWRARTVRFDRQFRLLETRVDVAAPDGRFVATGMLRSYVRFSPVESSAAELAARLSSTAKSLSGATALVVGGTRGLGADLTTALAVAGCRVYASFNRDREAAADLERRLAEAKLRATFLHGDAGDPGWCGAAVERIRGEGGRLDLLILNACAAPAVLRAGPSTADRASRYVSDNLRLVEMPLASGLPAIHESGGAVVYISSSFVEEPPAGFGPYVAVKQAGEGLLRAAARESGAFDALIVRPPRLRTVWNDTPAGVAGTIPADWVASHVVNRLGEHRGSRRVDTLSAFPPFARETREADKVRATGVAVGPAEPRTEFSLALAGSFTLDPILPGLRFWMEELRLAGDVDVAPYGQVVQTLLNPAGVFASSRRGLNVVLLRVGDWIRELPADEAASVERVRAHLERAVSDVDRAVRTHRARGGTPTLLMICPSTAAVSRDVDSAIVQAETDLAARMHGLPGLQVVRSQSLHGLYGVADDGVHDALRDRIGHIPYRDEYFHVLATIAMRQAHRRVSPPSKVVVVDADNTLWRGVVGELGPEGVAFDEGHRALHRTLVRLSQSGVVVAICSKNEESDVWEVFDTRGDFELRREHIVGAAINWQNKSQNLRALASRLNLGLDSFVFIDDNPVECAEVRARCPEVLTLEWPQESGAAISLLRHTWELDAGDATAEDRRRTEMYREELQRRELREGALTLREFLDGLDLRIDVAPLAPEDLRRASQLTLRTNQFNFTTRRRDEAEMQALVSGGRHEVRTVRVRDRFGDYGLVGLLVAEWRDDLLVADTFLLSCRVLGRGVEHRMAAEFGRMALARGAEAVVFGIDFTKKNTPARQFLQAIAPAGQLSIGESRMECRMSSGQLADLRFDPSENAGGVPTEGDDERVTERMTPAERAVSGSPGEPEGFAPQQTGRRREREAQIVRTATELSTPSGLATAIASKSVAQAGETRVARAVSASPGVPEGFAAQTSSRRLDAGLDVAEKVESAFASALHVPVTKIRELDRLEALGCDSLKIVEITVELIDAFPWVPPTLLFEHRTVSEIARAISALRGGTDTPSDVGRALSSLDDARDAPERVEGSGPPRERGRLVPQATGSTDIAVIGMHLRCAGASSPGELWDLLSGRRSAVREVPHDRRHFLHPLADTRAHWAGLLDEVGRFDAEFFGVSPREAEYMDPQLRLFLEVAWGALEDAGCAGEGHDPSTGVFAGVMYGDYGARANLGSIGAASPYRCWEGFSLANRLSQLLGFSGPSLAVDTACSSSGTALHLACAALKAGECRVAVVGGVNLILDPDRFASLGRLGILSARGRCEPFGADADGTVLGEGAGVVILRPLDEALRRGDRIYGIIKGTGLSTGSGTVGFTAPNPQAQAEAIRRSLQAARVDPRTISYVETHGTGTALGDPIEVRGLTLAHGTRDLLDASVDIEARCTLGSIKPNIGHLEAGAGVLGLIKVLLQLERRMLLPSITSSEPNPQIPFAGGPFDVQRELAEWRQPVARVDGRPVPVPRRAGLSSFGVGGANAHVIVEEPPRRSAAAARPERPLHLLTLSARNEASLRQQAEQLLRHVECQIDIAVGDLCYSAASGRRHFDHRVAVPVATREDLQAALRDIGRGVEPRGGARGTARSGSPPKIAFLFTGQGSQYAGMGRHLYDTQPVFRDAVDRAATVLDTLLERPLRDVMFAREGTADADLVNQTAYTQPALFVFEYAMSRLWQSWGIRPDVVVGHSIGEIAAMCAAGGMSLEDGLRLVEARGRLMQALPPGGVMTSVMADEARVREAMSGTEESVAIAAVNAPGQVVISGEGSAVARISAHLMTQGIKTKALTVSHAFHSPLMKPMLPDYEHVVRQIALSRPRTKFVSTVDPGLDAAITLPEYWLRNVIDPVRFADAMKVLEAERVDVCIEVGPHPVLLGLGRQSVVDEARVEWLPSAKKDGDGWQTLLESVARLHVRGGSVDWQRFDAPYARRRVSVPVYPFAGKEYWLKSAARPAARQKPELYDVVWREVDWMDGATPGGAWIILADQRGVGAELADALHERGVTTTLVAAGTAFEETGTRSYTIDPSNPEHFVRLWSAVARDGAIQRVVHLWSLDAPPAGSVDVATLDGAVTRSVWSVVHAAQALAVAGVSYPALWVVTSGAVWTRTPDVRGADLVRSAQASLKGSPHDPTVSVAVAQAPVWGLGRTIALEHSELWGGLIDVAHVDPRAAARLLVRELMCAGGEDQVALSVEGRFVPRLVRRALPVESAHPVVRSDGAYLVTGGIGALGLQIARWLVERGARHVVLSSRRTADEAVREAIEPLERAGATVSIVPADVSKAEDLEGLFARIAAGELPLRGIIHAAGVDSIIPLTEMTARDVETALAAKVRGGWLLHERTRRDPLDFFVCFSSLASVLGSQGRAHYAAANAFLDALVAERRRLGLAATSINWGPWQGGGMAHSAHLQQFERIGNHGLEPADAVETLESVIRARLTQVVVVDIDWEIFCSVYEARRPRPMLAEIAAAGRESARRAAAAVDRVQRSPSGDEVAPSAEWVAALETIPAGDREAELARWLQREVADTLGFDTPASVALDRNFYEMGMDSLMMADLIGRLKKRVGLSVSALVFDDPDVQSLASRLMERLPIDDRGRMPNPSSGSAHGSTEDAGRVPGPSSSSARGPAGVQPAAAAVLEASAAVQVTGYHAAVEPEIFAFLSEAFPERQLELVPPRWRWMFVDAARRLGVEPRVWLHRTGGRIVGHMGSIPVRLKIGPGERDTGWLVETMVLSAYRNQAVGARLMVDAHDDQPFSLSLGQTAEMREIQFRLGWRQVAPLQTAQCLVRPENVLRGKLPGPAAYAASLGFRASATLRDLLSERRQFSSRPIERFDARHDRLWQEMSRDLVCAVVRDASYLNWKYVDQPGQQFLRLEVLDGDALEGVAVWMFREADQHYRYRRAFLVDVLAPLSDGSTLTKVVKAASGVAAAAGADALLCHHIDERLTNALRDCGFHSRKPERFFLVDPAPLTGKEWDLVLSPGAWFITQGDSDIDRPW